MSKSFFFFFEVTFYVIFFKITPVFAVWPLVARWVPEYDYHQNQSDSDIQIYMVMETDNDGNDSKDNKADLFFWEKFKLNKTSIAKVQQ